MKRGHGFQSLQRLLEIFAGYEPREGISYAVAHASFERHRSQDIAYRPLNETALRKRGLYWRPHEIKDGQLWCPISDAPMTTVFANLRFLAPFIARSQVCLYADFADMLALSDISELFSLADDQYAVQVVKHNHVPRETFKMDRQCQTVYPRKNWSSLILWNWAHPANRRLTLEMVNTLPGRDLHAFCWLEDGEIGELPVEWNYLVGVTTAQIKPKLLHFTLATPELGRYDPPWSDLWLDEWAAIDQNRANIVRAQNARLLVDTSKPVY